MLCFFVLCGCETTEVQNKSIKFSLPNDIPNFVTESDFEKINWEKVTDQFETSERSDMLGNKNKLGIIGSGLKTGEVEKWLWHFWGIDEGEFTVVGFNRDNSKISPIFFDGAWSINSIASGKVNGADSSIPSSVLIPEAGVWAFLVYIDGELFDTLIINIGDKK